MTKEEIIAKAYQTYPDAPSHIPDSGDINYDQALKREDYIKALNGLNKLSKNEYVQSSSMPKSHGRKNQSK